MPAESWELAVRPPRHTMYEWAYSNSQRVQRAEEACQRTDQLVQESEQLCDATRRLAINQCEVVESVLDSRVREVEQWQHEVDVRVKNCNMCHDKLEDFKQRLERAEIMTSQAKDAFNKCLAFRSKREGIEIVNDIPHNKLTEGVALCNHTLSLIQNSHHQVSEQIRLTKAMLYKLSIVMTNKYRGRDVDQLTRSLKAPPGNAYLHISVPPSHMPWEQWREDVQALLQRADTLVNANQRMYPSLEQLLDQTYRDLHCKWQVIQERLEDRIANTRRAKVTMESELAKVVQRIEDANANLKSLLDHIEERKSRLTLANKRLHTRTMRPLVERCRDKPELELEKEVAALTESIRDLQTREQQTRRLLQQLMRNQSTLEYDIDIKANTLKLDEVQCLGVLGSVNLHVV